MEEIKKQLYEYLDGYSFANYDEIVLATNEFFREKTGEYPSMGDLLDYQDYAIEYMIDRNVEFEKDIVHGFDLNHVDEWKKTILDYKMRKDGK